jgi:hypothetical protein
MSKNLGSERKNFFGTDIEEFYNPSQRLKETVLL